MAIVPKHSNKRIDFTILSIKEHPRCPKPKQPVALLESAEDEGNEKSEKNVSRLVREFSNPFIVVKIVTFV